MDDNLSELGKLLTWWLNESFMKKGQIFGHIRPVKAEYSFPPAETY